MNEVSLGLNEGIGPRGCLQGWKYIWGGEKRKSTLPFAQAQF